MITERCNLPYILISHEVYNLQINLNLTSKLQKLIVSTESSSFYGLVLLLSILNGIILSLFPLFLYFFLLFIAKQHNSLNISTFIVYIVVFIIILIGKVIVPLIRSRLVQRYSLKLREHIFKQTYDKLLNNTKIHEESSVIARLSYDVDNLVGISSVLSEFITTATILICTILSLFYIIGNSAIITIVTLLLLFPLSKFIAHKFVKLSRVIQNHREDRLSLLEEMIIKIRGFKYLAITHKFSDKVHQIRSREIASRTKFMAYNA